MILGVSDKNEPKENTPMALDESALSELVDAFRAGDGLDVVREAVRMMF